MVSEMRHPTGEIRIILFWEEGGKEYKLEAYATSCDINNEVEYEDIYSAYGLKDKTRVIDDTIMTLRLADSEPRYQLMAREANADDNDESGD